MHKIMRSFAIAYIFALSVDIDLKVLRRMDFSGKTFSMKYP